MILVGQSLTLHRGPVAAALYARDAGPIVARARRQIDAGADALDLNLGRTGTGDDLAWVVRVLRDEAVDLPLWLDAATPAVLCDALARCQHAGPLVVNALPVGDGPEADEAALLDAIAGSVHSLVLSPHRLDVTDIEHRTDATGRAIDRARAAGFDGVCYADALAYPARTGVASFRRSLDALDSLATRLTHAVPLVAVGNVSYGLPVAVGRALRNRYAAAAVRAGAGALIVPVEEPSCVVAARCGQAAAPPFGASPEVVAAWQEAARLLGA